MTKYVEWYYGDFSDPEAVSGSSTMVNMKADFGLFCVPRNAAVYKNLAVENSDKNDKNIIQKSIDLST